MLGEEINLEDVFIIEVTSKLGNLVFPNSTIRQNPNYYFHKYIIDVSKPCEQRPTNEVH